MPRSVAAAGHPAGNPEVFLHGRRRLGRCAGVSLLLCWPLPGAALAACLPQHARCSSAGDSHLQERAVSLCLEDTSAGSKHFAISVKCEPTSMAAQAFYLCTCIFTSLSFAQPAYRRYNWDCWSSPFVSAPPRSEVGQIVLFRIQFRGCLTIARAAKSNECKDRADWVRYWSAKRLQGPHIGSYV